MLNSFSNQTFHKSNSKSVNWKRKRVKTLTINRLKSLTEIFLLFEISSDGSRSKKFDSSQVGSIFCCLSQIGSAIFGLGPSLDN